MSRDRLNRGGYGDEGGNPYAQQGQGDFHSSGPYQTQGGGYQQSSGYSQVPSGNGGYGQSSTGYGNGNEYEMNTYGQSSQSAGTLSDFFAQRTEVATAIDTLNANVTRLDSLHNRSLNDLPDDPNTQNTHRQIDSMMADTNKLTNSIRMSVKDLEARAKAARGGDQKTMVTQTEALKKKFRDSITRFQQVEKAYRDRTRQRMERQLRIVKPDASQQEIQAAIDDDQGGQIFSQALMTSTRHGEARSALREVQSRHQDIQKIERTITELAQLFNEMSIMIEVQEQAIDNIETKAQETETQMESGLQHTEAAVVSARAARRKKWYCLGIIVLIIIIIVVIILILKFATGSI